MKKIATLIFFILCIFHKADAITDITTPTVSGHWTASGSPYYIHNDISINAGTTLIIDPGVQIIFLGQYIINVYGVCNAVGTSSLPITFDIQDTTGWYLTTSFAGGWRGVNFGAYASTSPDFSELKYCNFSHMKSYGLGVVRNMKISYCNFHYNSGRCVGLSAPTSGPLVNSEFSHCNFHNNDCATYLYIFTVDTKSKTWNIHHNQFYMNRLVVANSRMISFTNATMLFEDNEVHDNVADAESTLIIGESSRGLFSRNKIYKNSGWKVAPLSFAQCAVDINGNYICNNKSTISTGCGYTDGGGGIRIFDFGTFNSDTTMYVIRNNIIANNLSLAMGGGIYTVNANLLITNNTIINNKSTRGPAIDVVTTFKKSVCIRNNIFRGNQSTSATFGNGNVYIANQYLVKLKYDHNWTQYPFCNDVMKSTTVDTFGQLLSDTSTNIVGANPGLVSPTLTSDPDESALTANFNLLSSSPCIDKGAKSSVINGWVDYAGKNRIDNDSVDIGAYEFGATAATASAPLVVDTIFAKCCNVITIAIDTETLHLSANFSERHMSVNPNPATNIIAIQCPNPTGNIEVYDMNGKLIMSKRVTDAVTFMDIRDIARGIYFAVWVDGQGKRSFEKVVVE